MYMRSPMYALENASTRTRNRPESLFAECSEKFQTIFHNLDLRIVMMYPCNL